MCLCISWKVMMSMILSVDQRFHVLSFVSSVIAQSILLINEYLEVYDLGMFCIVI